MNLPMDRMQVGQYLPGCRTHGRYVRAELAEGMWRVFVGVPTMTSDELAQFRGGAIRFAPVAEAGRLLFLLRFGELPWVCAQAELRGGAAPQEAKLACVFVDSDSGVAQEIRVVPLNAAANARIGQLCQALTGETPARRAPDAEALLCTVDPANIFTPDPGVQIV